MYTDHMIQEEESLLCKVAAEHDQTDAMHLSQSPGWKTLMAILESYGERTLKRPWPLDENNVLKSASSSEHLAKRFKQAASINS